MQTVLGFEVFAMVNLENNSLKYLRPCSLIDVYRRLGETYFFAEVKYEAFTAAKVDKMSGLSAM
jgi:hypothetical protein